VNLDSNELKFIAQTWGEEFADALIADPRWPGCNQSIAVTAAEAIVRTAIKSVAAVLDGGGDFKPHVGMMSATTWCAFQDSMPSKTIFSARVPRRPWMGV
jgi:hypothetical protein